jgi:hypothetical protein
MTPRQREQKRRLGRRQEAKRKKNGGTGRQAKRTHPKPGEGRKHKARESWVKRLASGLSWR